MSLDQLNIVVHETPRIIWVMLMHLIYIMGLSVSMHIGHNIIIIIGVWPWWLEWRADLRQHILKCLCVNYLKRYYVPRFINRYLFTGTNVYLPLQVCQRQDCIVIKTNCFNNRSGCAIGFNSNLTDAVSLFEKIEILPISDTRVLQWQIIYLRYIFHHLKRRRGTFHYLSKLFRAFNQHLCSFWTRRRLTTGKLYNLEFRS